MTRRKFDKDFKENAVRLVRETGKPIAQIARDLGINSKTLGNWVKDDRDRTEEVRERHEKLSDDVDAILDEIDEVLEESAEEFVRSYVIKGGQGWSTFIDPSFFVGAATASIVAAVTYDAFKKMIASVIHAINKVPGPVETRVFANDGSLDPGFEQIVNEAWEVAHEMLGPGAAQHSMDEATALHWTVFFRELMNNAPLVKLEPDQFERVRRAGAARSERLTPSQVISLVVSEWLSRNPNAEIGLWK
jgi:ubiquitin-like protein Pup